MEAKAGEVAMGKAKAEDEEDTMETMEGAVELSAPLPPKSSKRTQKA